MALDVTADLVVVGSGMAGLTAAVTAQARGLQTLVVEKSRYVGGTSAWSGGMLWIPNSHHLAEAGVEDSFEAGLAYLNALTDGSEPATSPARKTTFLREGPRLVRFLEGLGVEFEFVDGYPDYYPDLPGGQPRGRGLSVRPFDARCLGPWEPWLRPPSGTGQKLVVLLETMADATPMTRLVTTAKGKRVALRAGLRAARGKLARARRVTLGRALVGRMLHAAQRLGVDLRLGASVEDLLVSENGTVNGVVISTPDGRAEVFARGGVVLAAGGFAHNDALRKELGRPASSSAWTSAVPEDTGDLIVLAQKYGALTALTDEAVWTPVSVPPDGAPTPVLWERTAPHSIIVDRSGVRFCNEAGSYMELGQAMFGRETQVGAISAWLVFDQRHRRRYPFGTTPPALTPRSWLRSGYMKRSSTVRGLAEQCGIDPDGLLATINRFNQSARSGTDHDFGRGANAHDRYFGDPAHHPNPSLGEISKPPYYAVALHPGDLGTSGGLLTDEHGRVLGEKRQVIEGLYAAGANAASVMGRMYPGPGCSLGPGAVFAYVAASHAASRANEKTFTVLPQPTEQA